MSTITPHYRNVQQLLQSQSFSIDEYQREYKWEKENIDELLSDLQGKFFNYYKQGDETEAISIPREWFSSTLRRLAKIFGFTFLFWALFRLLPYQSLFPDQTYSNFTIAAIVGFQLLLTIVCYWFITKKITTKRSL